jgi:hypothetical protein
MRGTTFAIGALLLANAACSPHKPSVIDEEDVSFVQDGVDTLAVHNDGQALTASLIGVSGLRLIEGPSLVYLPRGCLTASVGGGMATYSFNNCVGGPYGLLRVNGTIKMTTMVTADMHLVIDASSSSLEVGQAMFSWTAHFDIHRPADLNASDAGSSGSMSDAGPDLAEGGTVMVSKSYRQMEYTSMTQGTTAHGHPFMTTSTGTTSWIVGDECLATFGEVQGNVGSRAFKNEILELTRCAHSCPREGSEVVFADSTSGRQLDVRFDGTSNAQVSGPGFSTVAVPLGCNP